MISFSKIQRTNLTPLVYVFLIFGLSCGHKNKAKEITESKIIIKSNNDSLVNALFEHGQQYFNIQNIDTITAKYGNPINSYKTQWCAGICDDSLLTSFEYPSITFAFFEKDNSIIELENIYTFDKTTSFPANLTIGKTTRNEILERFGPLDTDDNYPSRSMVKSGDTLTFIYDINIDEYAISLSMIKDTLHKISWTKNMN